MRRRIFMGGGLCGVGAALYARGVMAQAAGGAMRVIFPFAAGGPGDALSRLVADAIGAAEGRAGIVENRTGADGRIGIQAVKNSGGSGDTLLVTTGPTMWLMPIVHAAPGYDPVKDFAPVSLLARFDFCLAVANNSGVGAIADFPGWLKANPQKASYGIPGLGTIPHFIGTRLARLLGVEMVRVVYRGSTPAVNDVISGQIPIIIVPLSDGLQQHRAGNLRILAVTGAERSPFLDTVPTLRESGIDLTGDAWYALWAPAATPADQLGRYHGAVVQLLQRSNVKERLSNYGLIAVGSTATELAGAMAEATATWGPVVRETGFRIEQ